MPTEAFKAGDFSALGVPIFDPATTRSNGQGGVVRDQFPGNIIPANRISPAARALLRSMPSTDLAGANNNFFDRRSPTWPSFNTSTPLIKINHNLTTSQRLMGSVPPRRSGIASSGASLDPVSDQSRPGGTRRSIRSTGLPTRWPTAGRYSLTTTT